MLRRKRVPRESDLVANGKPPESKLGHQSHFTEGIRGLTNLLQRRDAPHQRGNYQHWNRESHKQTPSFTPAVGRCADFVGAIRPTRVPLLPGASGSLPFWRKLVVCLPSTWIGKHIASLYDLTKDGLRTGVLNPPGIEFSVEPLIGPSNSILGCVAWHAQYVIVIPGCPWIGCGPNSPLKVVPADIPLPVRRGMGSQGRTRVPRSVVLRPPHRISQYLVGGIDLLEPVLGLGIPVHVRMVLKGKATEGLLYIPCAG